MCYHVKLTIVPRHVKNSFKIAMLKVIYESGGHMLEFTSTSMFASLLPPGLFSPKAVEMGLMRYAKRGFLSRRRVGREYHYSPNDSTFRAFIYYFGRLPSVPRPGT
jgi:hypothetical protein